MKHVIWKYPVPLHASWSLWLPADAVILAIQMQGDTPQMWVRTSGEGNLQQQRHFAIVGTGYPEIDPTWQYLTTFQTPPYVWHVFEVVTMTAV